MLKPVSHILRAFLMLFSSASWLDINLIFDVGANEGQFAKKIIENGYKGKIISFEPLNDPYEKLVLKSSKFENWKVGKLSLGS